MKIEYDLALALRFSIPRLPPTVGNLLLNQEEALRALDLPRGELIELFEHRFDRAALLSALRVFSNGQTLELRSLDGELTITQWRMANDGAAIVTHGGASLRFPHVALLGEDAVLRMRIFSDLVTKQSLPRIMEEKWHPVIEGGALSDEAFLRLEDEINDRPRAILRELLARIGAQDAQFDELVPRDETYYLGLIGLAEAPSSFSAFRRNWLAMARRQRAAQLRELLYASASLSIVDGSILTIAAKTLSDRNCKKLVQELIGEPDPLAHLAALQICVEQSPTADHVELAARASEQIFQVDTALMQNAGADYAAAQTITGAILGREQVLAGWSLFARRLASLLHASQLVRILARSAVERPAFHDQVERYFGSIARLAELMEGREAPVYFHRQLNPLYRHGLIVRGAFTALVGKQDRAFEPLREMLMDSIRNGQKNGLGAFYLVPGPLDELLPDWAGLTELNADALSQFLNSLESTQSVDVGTLVLSQLLLAYEVPTAERANFSKRLLDLVARVEIALLPAVTEGCLRLASRWRDKAFSDALLEAEYQRRQDAADAGQPVEPRLIIAAANCEANKTAWLNRLEMIANAFCQAQWSNTNFMTLVRALGWLGEIDHELRACLKNARSMAILAHNRVGGT